MTPLEVLKGARVLIERGWTTRAFARDHHGYQVDPDDANATCFCMVGALRKVSDYAGWRCATPSYLDARDVLARVVEAKSGCYTIPQFNDDFTTTKEAVLDMFDAAIERTRT